MTPIHYSDIDADEIIDFILSANGKSVGPATVVAIVLAAEKCLGLRTGLIGDGERPAYVYPH